MICFRCHELKEQGRLDGRNFVCSDCIAKEQRTRATINRRERLPDGRVCYPGGHILAIPQEEQ